MRRESAKTEEEKEGRRKENENFNPKKTRNTQETLGNREFFSRAEQSLAASAISLPLQDTDLSRLIYRYLGISFATLQEEEGG